MAAAGVEQEGMGGHKSLGLRCICFIDRDTCIHTHTHALIHIHIYNIYIKSDLNTY